MAKSTVYGILAVGFTYTVTIFGGAFASGREIMQFFGGSAAGVSGVRSGVWSCLPTSV